MQVFHMRPPLAAETRTRLYGMAYELGQTLTPDGRDSFFQHVLHFIHEGVRSADDLTPSESLEDYVETRIKLQHQVELALDKEGRGSAFPAFW